MPIGPVPIVPTALSKNLSGPMSISHMQGTPKTGYVLIGGFEITVYAAYCEWCNCTCCYIILGERSIFISTQSSCLNTWRIMKV